MSKETKTNAMRILDSLKVPYKKHYYNNSISGCDVAAELGEDPQFVFKTLVTTGKSGKHYVFLIPVNQQLDLKKAANAAGEKSINMLKSKDLFELTGYIHGGCSPIGMKKLFPTFIHSSAGNINSLFCSGGKIGFQIELSPDDLAKAIKFELHDITVN